MTEKHALDFAIVEPITIEQRPLTKDVPIYTGKELAEPLQPIEYAVEYLGLAPGAPTLIAGYGGCGKTMFAQHLLICIASGRPLFGLYPVGQGAVVHIDFEQGRRTTQERYQRFAQAASIDLNELGDQLNLITNPGFTLEADDAFERLVELIEGKRVAVVDCLKASAPTRKENDSEVRQTLDLLGRVSEYTGACIIVIAHARKSSGDEDNDSKYVIRGSSAIFDACSSVFVLTAAKDQPTRVAHWKDRHRGQPTPDFWFRIQRNPDDGTDEYGLLLQHLEAGQLDNGPLSKGPTAHERSRILAVLERGIFTGSRTDLRAAVGMGTPRFNLALSALLGDGSVLQRKNADRQTQFGKPGAW